MVEQVFSLRALGFCVFLQLSVTEKKCIAEYPIDKTPVEKDDSMDCGSSRFIGYVGEKKNNKLYICFSFYFIFLQFNTLLNKT